MQVRSVAIAGGLLTVALLAVRFLRTDPPAPPAQMDRGGAAAEPSSAVTNAPVPVASAPVQPRIAPAAPPSAAERPADLEPHGGDRNDAGVSRAQRTTESLIADLGSKDDFVVLEAADELSKRRATQAVASLAAIDIKGRANAAPTVIDALGRLGGSDDASARRTATDRLLALLAQERTNDAPESPGNVLGIYEALGRTKDPRAAAALEAELLDPNVRLAAKSVIIDALVRLKQPKSREAILALRGQLASYAPKEELDDERLRLLGQKIERALRELP